jgi:hypothetical protein
MFLLPQSEKQTWTAKRRYSKLHHAVNLADELAA